MSRYAVRLLPRARVDADHIYVWLSAHSPSGAERWLSALTAALKSLESAPLARGFAAEVMLKRQNVRQKLFKSRRGRVYRLLFVVVADEVRILRVRGPGQPPIAGRDLPPQRDLS